MPFVYAALAFVVAGVMLALAQGLIVGAFGLRLTRVEPWRSIATVARIALSAVAAWIAFDAVEGAAAGPSATVCIQDIYRYPDGTEGLERPSEMLGDGLEMPVYPVQQRLVPC